MAGDFIAAASGRADTAAASLTIAWPAVAAGDVVILCAGIDSALTFTTPSDHAGSFTSIDNNNAGVNCITRLWWYRCDGAETGNLTVAWTGGTTTGIAGILVYRGIYSGGDPTEVHNSSSNTATSNSRQCTGLASTSTHTFLQLCFVTDRGIIGPQSWTPPAGMVERLDATNPAGGAVWHSVTAAEQTGLIAPAGGGSTKTFTSANNSTADVGFNLGLRLEVPTTFTDPLPAAPPFGQTAPELVPCMAFTGGYKWPDYGQGWPRRRLVSGR